MGSLMEPLKVFMRIPGEKGCQGGFRRFLESFKADPGRFHGFLEGLKEGKKVSQRF